MFLGLFICLALIVAASIYSGTHRQESGLSSLLVGGVLLGTVIGGSCTIGTAQLAYLYGACAWWFCLGSAIALVILGLFFTLPFRAGQSLTIMGIISQEYGKLVGMAASILSSVGIFINILCQLIAATSVIAVVLPELSLNLSLLLSASFMVIYVVFGGTRGAAIVGIVKLILVYISMILCGIIVLKFTGGFNGFIEMVREIEASQSENFLDIFSRGVGKEMGSCLAVIVGITTTQIYAQAVCAARTDKVARCGTVASAVLIPVIGAMGILVGLYMRAHFPGIAAKTALTQFIQMQMPEVVSGLILGTLFITVIGTGAGLALGIATVVNSDIVQAINKAHMDSRYSVLWVRALIISVLAAAALICMLLDSDLILNYAFLSMGLRGSVVFAPLCCALWLKGQIHPLYAMLAVALGPISECLIHFFFSIPFDPLFVGIAISIGIMMIGYFKHRSETSIKATK